MYTIFILLAVISASFAETDDCTDGAFCAAISKGMCTSRSVSKYCPILCENDECKMKKATLKMLRTEVDKEEDQEDEECRDRNPRFCRRDPINCESSMVRKNCRLSCNLCKPAWDVQEFDDENTYVAIESSDAIVLGNACLSAYRAQSLKEQNIRRSKHQFTGPLKGSAAVNRIAQAYAQHLADIGVMEHSGRPGYGENLAMSGGVADLTDASTCAQLATEFVNMWYDEIKNYDWSDPTFSMNTGHFTQLVWNTTTTVGSGLAMSKGTNMVFAVANYLPPGNIIGAFAECVNPLKK